MNIFWEYLKSRARPAVFLLLAAGIFALIFFLYGLPAEGYLLALALCMLAGAGFLIFDCARFWRRHAALSRRFRAVAFSAEGLPEPRSLIERDYTTLIEEACRSRQRLLAEAEQKRCELADYFTLWAHQIKTPIAAAELILQGAEPAESRELDTQLFRIEQYVEMVLAYLRMDGESRDFVFREQSLDRLVRQSVRRLSGLFINSGNRLELGALEARVLTDEKWLCFCVEQVLTNAIKYTHQGVISVYAQGETLVIRDTGIGIAPEDLPRIGEKGYTGYNGRTDQKATGLGLYLTRRILKKLGHTFAIDSAPGKGTTVRIGLQTARPVYE